MTSIKRILWGAVIGSIVTMIIGFAWGGWVTKTTAEQLAMQRASTAVTAALVPVCLEKAKTDPMRLKKLGALKTVSSWEQRDAVIKDGWATVGTAEANSDVAEACAYQLLSTAAK